MFNEILPVLAQDEARELLESIDVSTVVGLRDRALIAMMTYTFGRVGAVIKMRIEDYYTQGRRGWVRLHEKGGKRHEMPCNHNLEAYLDAYISAASIADDFKGYLFRSTRGKTKVLTGNPLAQSNVYRMIRRRAMLAGIKARIGNHTFRAIGLRFLGKSGGYCRTFGLFGAVSPSGLACRHGEKWRIQALSQVANGAAGDSEYRPAEAYLSNTEGPNGQLSVRERQVLQLVAEGHSTKKVASLLSISTKTADTHRTRLMEKLDIHQTAGLVRYAIRNGMLEP